MKSKTGLQKSSKAGAVRNERLQKSESRSGSSGGSQDRHQQYGKNTLSNGLAHYQWLFGAPHAYGTLDRTSLRTPLAYLVDRHLLTDKAHGEWVSITCPVHKNGTEAHPSLRVSLVDGHFRCMACGVSGGDLIALHRLLTGKGFREAVIALGGRFHDE